MKIAATRPAPTPTRALAHALARALALALALTLTQESFAARPNAGASFAPDVSIRVEPGGWGDVSTGDIAAVLQSTAHALTADAALRQPIDVIVVHGDEPETAFERNEDGAFVVTLAVEGAYWSQLAYQFSHELCHVLSLNERRIETATDWFEESVCEAVSLVTLRRMARQWAGSEDPSWRSFAPEHARYVERVIARRARLRSRRQSLRSWYVCRIAELSANRYDRDNNGVIANALMPIIERDGRAIAAITSLNRSAVRADRSIADLVTAWRTDSSAAHRAIINALVAPFRATPTAQERASCRPNA